MLDSDRRAALKQGVSTLVREHYDLIVIGSGPGGASLAQRLAPTGKRVLIVERGDYLQRSEKNWSSQSVFVDGLYQAKESWINSLGKTFSHAPQIRGEVLPPWLEWLPRAHQAGTARFGTDSDTSVLDLDCRAHEIDNPYLADASFFPSIGAVNPTLTMIANALRVADKIKERL